MANNAPPAGEGQAPNPQPPQAGDPHTPPQPPQAGADQAKTAADYERMIADLRKENASARTKLTAFEKAQADAEAAKLSELEKATKRAEAAEAAKTALELQHQQTVLHLAMLKTAVRVGLTTPETQDAALKLLDPSVLEFDDDGQPKNMEKALKDLLEKYPFLKPADLPQPKPPAVPPMNPARSAVTTPNQSPRGRPLSMSEAFKLHEQQKQQGR